MKKIFCVLLVLTLSLAGSAAWAAELTITLDSTMDTSAKIDAEIDRLAADDDTIAATGNLKLIFEGTTTVTDTITFTATYTATASSFTMTLTEVEWNATLTSTLTPTTSYAINANDADSFTVGANGSITSNGNGITSTDGTDIIVNGRVISNLASGTAILTNSSAGDVTVGGTATVQAGDGTTGTAISSYGPVIVNAGTVSGGTNSITTASNNATITLGNTGPISITGPVNDGNGTTTINAANLTLKDTGITTLAGANVTGTLKLDGETVTSLNGATLNNVTAQNGSTVAVDDEVTGKLDLKNSTATFTTAGKAGIVAADATSRVDVKAFPTAAAINTAIGTFELAQNAEIVVPPKTTLNNAGTNDEYLEDVKGIIVDNTTGGANKVNTPLEVSAGTPGTNDLGADVSKAINADKDPTIPGGGGGCNGGFGAMALALAVPFVLKKRK